MSVSSKECPGAARCPKGDVCFAEQARRAAAEASVVVVNPHLYGLHLESGGVILPEHDVVVIDEAHQLEDTISATFGIELGASRFASLARSVRAILDAPDLVDQVDASGLDLARSLAPHVGRRLKGRLEPEIADALALASERLERVRAALGRIDDSKSGDVEARRQRAVKTTGVVTDEVAVRARPADRGRSPGSRAPTTRPSLRLAPIDVAGDLQATLWSRATAVLTSATIAARRCRCGSAWTAPTTRRRDPALRPARCRQPLRLRGATRSSTARPTSPTRARRATRRRSTTSSRRSSSAAGGRTLALFTSYRAMDAALDELRRRLPWPLLGQRDLPEAGAGRAVRGRGGDVPVRHHGVLAGHRRARPVAVARHVDRLPFPRPDEPLLQARRERARADAFRLVDLPRAATLLAQGAGRLIRTATDRGVVAVLDPRLATNPRYRWDIVRALPPMRRTKDRAEVEAFLRSLRG